MAGKPTLSDFREVINKLDALIAAIDEMPDSYPIGAIELRTGKQQ